MSTPIEKAILRLLIAIARNLAGWRVGPGDLLKEADRAEQAADERARIP